MIKRYTDEEYNIVKSEELLKLECEHCGRIFTVKKKTIKHELKVNGNGCRFCSQNCHYEHVKNERIKVKCEECGKEFEIVRAIYKNSISKHFFCSSSCSACYNNKLRTLSEDTKKKISNSIKSVWNDERKKKCITFNLHKFVPSIVTLLSI